MMYDVEISQLELMALFDLQGSQKALAAWCGGALPDFPAAPLRLSQKDGMDLMSVGPDHWLLRAPLAQEEALRKALRPDQAPDDISVVLISDTLSFFAVTGAEADEVMAVATPLDLHPSVFPQDGATFTEAFSTKAVILRVPGGYHIGVERSYGPMIADYLARSTAG